MEKLTEKEDGYGRKLLRLTEITRSFSRKVSSPTNRYENSDVLCSQKLEVPLDEVEQASKDAFHFCKIMVERDVANINQEMAEKETVKPIPEYIKKAFKNDAEQEAGESVRQENNK